MGRPTIVRMVGLVVLLAAAFYLTTKIAASDATKATLFLTAVIAAVTAVYALLTYEILIQNQAMARAAIESSRVMEQSLRFSFSPSILMQTLLTKNPKLTDREVTAHKNLDYDRFLREHVGSETQTEFVFTTVRNVGRGAATKVKLSVTFRIRDTANPNQTYTVTKEMQLPLLESGQAVAVPVYLSRTPTADDHVELVVARITYGDFYRDALGETPIELEVVRESHSVERDNECILKVT